MWETWVQSLGREIPWRRKWQPTPISLPGKSHGRRSLVGYSPWGPKELDTTELLHFTSLLYLEIKKKNWGLSIPSLYLPYIRINMCNLFFFFWLTSLCIPSSRFIRFTLTHMCSFLWVSDSPLYIMYYNFFIHSFARAGTEPQTQRTDFEHRRGRRGWDGLREWLGQIYTNIHVKEIAWESCRVDTGSPAPCCVRA